MLVDDHSGMREALRTVINSQPDLTVIAEAEDGRTALKLLERVKPDVVLMDGSMPEMNGIEATHRLKQLHPDLKIIGLTLYEQTTYLEEMIAAGASGYILKTGAPANLFHALRTVAAGETYFDPMVPRRSAPTAADPAATGDLNADELAVAKLLADGHTNVEVAAILGLTPAMVETHRTAAMKKLGLRSRAELVRLAAQRKWLDS